MTHNRAELRVVLPGAYGDEYTYQRALERFEQARSKQRVQFAVSPGQSVLLPNGIRLGAGAEVTAALMAGSMPSAEQAIRRLVAQGYVLEASGFDGGPQAA